jgi:large conductance mechanosensitive channel
VRAFHAAQDLQPGRRDLQRLGLLPHRLAHEVRCGRGIVLRIGLVQQLGILERVRLVQRRGLVIRLRLIGLRLLRLGVFRLGLLRLRLLRLGFLVGDGNVQLLRFRLVRFQLVLTPSPAQKGTAMLKGFKEFILRGNVIDLAVAVVIGAAFTAVVNSIVNNLFNPLIGAIFQADSLENSLTVSIGDADIKFGAVVGAIIQFLIVAVVVYFVFVYPINLAKGRAQKLRDKGVVHPDAPITELDVLTDIRDLLQAQRPAETAAGSGKHAE